MQKLNLFLLATVLFFFFQVNVYGGSSQVIDTQSLAPSGDSEIQE